MPAREAGPDSDAVILTPAAPLALIDLRCRDKAKLNAFLKAPTGLESPAVAQSVSNGKGTLSRLGPDWWQMRCADRKLADTLLRSAKPGVVGATDVSDAFVVIGIRGPRSRDVLSKAATIDLHASRFAEGATARTLFGRVTVIIARTNADEPPAFDVTVSRSNARFLWQWLADAAREYGYTLEPLTKPAA